MVTADSCGCRGTASFAEGNNAVLFSADVQRRFLSFLTSAAGYFFGSRRSDEQQRGGARWKARRNGNQVQQGRRTAVGGGTGARGASPHLHEELRGTERSCRSGFAARDR